MPRLTTTAQATKTVTIGRRFTSAQLPAANPLLGMLAAPELECDHDRGDAGQPPQAWPGAAQALIHILIDAHLTGQRQRAPAPTAEVSAGTRALGPISGCLGHGR